MPKKKYFTEKERKNANKLRLIEWRKTHLKQSAEYGKKYRIKNADEINKKRRLDRKKNPQKYSEYIKSYRSSTPKRFLAKKLSNVRSRAYKKERLKQNFDIDINFLIHIFNNQDKKCAITGYPMSLKFNCPYGISVDRIDSDIGYTRTNIQLVCQMINFAKNSFSNQQMIEF